MNPARARGVDDDRVYTLISMYATAQAGIGERERYY